MTGEVKPQRLKQTNKYFFCYKQLNTFDLSYYKHKCLDSELQPFFLVNRYIIFNKFDKDVPDHVTFSNQVTYSGNLVQTELPIERKPNQIAFG